MTPYGEKYYVENWYTKGCKLSGRLLVKNPEVARKNRGIQRERSIKEKEKKLEMENDAFFQIKKKYKPDDPAYIKAEQKYQIRTTKLGKEIRYLKDDEFVRSIKFSRFNVEPYEIAAFAQFALVLALLVMVSFDIFMLLAIPEGRDFTPKNSFDENKIYPQADKNRDHIRDIFQPIEVIEKPNFDNPEEPYIDGYIAEPLFSLHWVFILLVLPSIIIPFGVFIFISNYPEMNARRLKIHSLGSMPETVQYMSISMRLVPSLHKAIEFASDHISEPMASDLRKTLWNVYIKKFHSIEESFLDFINNWREVSDDFERSLYQIRSSVLERTKEGVDRNLDKANSIILEGTKQRIAIYSSKLSQPVMVLFSICILLPIMITTMLPIIGLKNEHWVLLVLGLNVLLPFLTYLYCFSIINKRPGTIPPPEIPLKINKNHYTMIAISIIVGFIIIGVGIYSSHISNLKDSDIIIKLIGPLPILWGIGFILSFNFRYIVRIVKIKRDNIRNMEQFYPDSLFQIGSRVGEGNTLEKSFQSTAQTMKGTVISGFLNEIAQKLQISKQTLEKLLFGKDGILKYHPSRMIKTSFKAIISAMGKDNVTAGKLIMNIASYLKELKRLEWEMEHKLDETMSVIITTLMIFAPIILGITSAMYSFIIGLREKVDPSVDLNLSMSPVTFNLIIGLYLLITLLIINNFASSIKYGKDRIESLYLNSISIPISITLYTISSISITAVFSLLGVLT